MDFRPDFLVEGMRFLHTPCGQRWENTPPQSPQFVHTGCGKLSRERLFSCVHQFPQHLWTTLSRQVERRSEGVNRRGRRD